MTMVINLVEFCWPNIHLVRDLSRTWRCCYD